ncbi:MAG: class I SAM-dependent methyltransferase [Desulfobacterales bacterium]|nr:class I SAM-dependent methyltransferase [Desulfobacterales bacterium]
MNTSEEQDIQRQAFFNTHARGWMDRFYGDPHRMAEYAPRLTRIVESLALEPDHRVLDAGCGSGVMVPLLLDHLSPRGRVVEVDYAQEMIQANRALHKDHRLEFICAPVDGLDLPRASFDAVLCFACFPHFRDPGASLSHLAGLLRPGGRLTIAHLMSSKKIADHHGKEAAVAHDRLPDPRRMSVFIQEAGLGVLTFTDTPDLYLLSLEKPTGGKGG